MLNVCKNLFEGRTYQSKANGSLTWTSSLLLWDVLLVFILSRPQHDSQHVNSGVANCRSGPCFHKEALALQVRREGNLHGTYSVPHVSPNIVLQTSSKVFAKWEDHGQFA